MEVVEEMDRAVMDLRRVRMMDRAGTAVTEMLLAGLAVGMTRAVKGRMEGLETVEDRKEAMEDRTGTLDQEVTEVRAEIPVQEAMETRTRTLDQGATEARMETHALTMGLVNRTQAVSHKSTYTRRS
jgi:hypothetical protein